MNTVATQPRLGCDKGNYKFSDLTRSGAGLSLAAPDMSKENIAKPVIVVLLLSLLLYVVTFSAIEHRRRFKGPWQLAFATDSNGVPSLSVSQPVLNIAGVRFVFDGVQLSQTNLAQVVAFDVDKTNVPFGKVIYFDTTFLPGVVTLDLFGNMLEFLPRTMVVNTNQVPWKSGETIRLPAGSHP